MLTSSLHINLFTLYLLNTCNLYKIMAENSKCNPCTSDFVSDTIKCKIYQKLMHYSCANVNLLANFIFYIAHQKSLSNEIETMVEFSYHDC